MANKFISWLENVPTELKKFFTNPVVDNAIVSGLGVVGIIDPALLPLVSGISAGVTKAEALAAAANVQTGSGEQKLALVTADAQQVFLAYEQQTGSKFETAQQTAVINAIVALLNNIPTSVPAVPQLVVSAPTTPAPAAPSVQTQVASNTLL